MRSVLHTNGSGLLKIQVRVSKLQNFNENHSPLSSCFVMFWSAVLHCTALALLQQVLVSLKALKTLKGLTAI